MKTTWSRIPLGLLAIGMAAFVACDTGADDDELDMDLDTEAATTQPMPRASTPLYTAQLQAGDAAEGEVGGSVAVYDSDLTRVGTGGGAGQAMSGQATTDTTARPGTGTGAAAQSRDGGFSVVVNANGLSRGEHAWHIHDAACGEQGSVVVAMTPTSEMEGLAEPLRVRANGIAADTAYVPGRELHRQQLHQSPHSLHIHQRGGTDHGPTVACADLRQRDTGVTGATTGDTTAL